MDYWQGSSFITPCADMLKMRYAIYPKDYFMGMLPSSQYGPVAVLPSINSVHESTSVAFGTDFRLGGYASLTNSNGGTSVVASSANTVGSAKYAFLNSDLSALSIRATEYLQRWKEVVQFSSKDYSDQMAAQFGKIGRAHV